MTKHFGIAKFRIDDDGSWVPDIRKNQDFAIMIILFDKDDALRLCLISSLKKIKSAVEISATAHQALLKLSLCHSSIFHVSELCEKLDPEISEEGFLRFIVESTENISK
jgi:hypothetical protein